MIRPEAAVAAHLRLAAEPVWLCVRAQMCARWEADSSGVRVITADGAWEADRLVLAPGAWAPALTRLRVPLRVQRRVQHYWRPADFGPFEAGRFPVWIWEYGPGLAAYGLPAPHPSDDRVAARRSRPQTSV